MSLVLNFRGIPDGVTVMASRMGTGMAMKDGWERFSPTQAGRGCTLSDDRR